jgi:hypothetical protein
MLFCVRQSLNRIRHSGAEKGPLKCGQGQRGLRGRGEVQVKGHKDKEIFMVVFVGLILINLASPKRILYH